MDTDVAPVPTIPADAAVVGVGPVATVYAVDGTAVKVFADGRRPGARAPAHPAIVVETGRGDIDTPDGLTAAYTVSPLAHRSLAAVVEDDSKRSWHEVSVLGVRLAGAIQTAHDAGVVHGGVKPTNVLVADADDHTTATAALGDFDHGGWRVAEDVPSGLGYVAPEVLDGAAPSAAADVYGLGATLLFALSGDAPFAPGDGDTLMRTLRRIMSEPVADVRPLRVPDDLASVVETAMAKDPAQRYGSAAAMGEALREAQRDHGHSCTPLDVGVVAGTDDAGSPATDVTAPELGDTPPPVERSTRARAWVLGVVAACALVAVAALVVLTVTSPPPRAGDSVAATNAPPTAASTPPTTLPGADKAAPSELPKGADASVFVDVPGYVLTDEATDSVVTDPNLAGSIIQTANVALVRTEDGRDVGAFVVLVLQEDVADDPEALAKIVDAVAPNPSEPPETVDIGGQPMIVTTTPDGLTAIAAQDPSGLVVGLLRGTDRGLMEQFLTALGVVAQ